MQTAESGGAGWNLQLKKQCGLNKFSHLNASHCAGWSELVFPALCCKNWDWDLWSGRGNEATTERLAHSKRGDEHM